MLQPFLAPRANLQYRNGTWASPWHVLPSILMQNDTWPGFSGCRNWVCAATNVWLRLCVFTQRVRSPKKRAKIGLVCIHTNRRLINRKKQNEWTGQVTHFPYGQGPVGMAMLCRWQASRGKYLLGFGWVYTAAACMSWKNWLVCVW